MTDVPGIGYGEYYRLSEIVDKKILATKHVVFELKNNLVFADGKPIQGLKIVDSYAQIKGIHYTSWENATQIRSMNFIKSSTDDPFVYLAPRGAMQNWPEREICKELGAKVANTEIWLEILVPLSSVWLKASRKVVHFAIDGDIHSDEINDIVIQRRRSE